MPIPLPDLPEGNATICLVIPDSPEWRQIYMGSLLLLQQWWYYNVDSIDAAQDVIQRVAECHYQTTQNYEGCKMTDCEDIANCIDTSEAVQSALQNYLVTKSGFLTPSANTAGMAVGVVSVPDCDYDELYGNCVAMWQMINQINIDFLEILVDATDSYDRLAKLITAIPVLETLPIDDAFALVNEVAEWTLDAYNAGLTVTLENQITCDLFCTAIESDCGLSMDQLIAYFSGYFGLDFDEYTFSDILDWLIDFVFSGAPTVYALTCLQLYVVATGNRFLGAYFPNMYGVAAKTGTPSNDWEELCECADFWAYSNDFALSSDGWAPYVNSAPFNYTAGVWVDGQGFDSTSYLAFTGNYERQSSPQITIPATNITRVSFVYDIVKGSWAASSQTMLFIRCYNGASLVAERLVNRADVSDGTDLELGLDLDTTVTRIRLGVRCSTSTTNIGALSGSGLIKSVHVQGTGTNPF